MANVISAETCYLPHFNKFRKYSSLKKVREKKSTTFWLSNVQRFYGLSSLLTNSMVHTYLRIMTLLTDIIMSQLKLNPAVYSISGKLVIFVNVFIKGRMEQVRACRDQRLNVQSGLLSFLAWRIKSMSNKIKVCE